MHTPSTTTIYKIRSRDLTKKKQVHHKTKNNERITAPFVISPAHPKLIWDPKGVINSKDYYYQVP